MKDALAIAKEMLQALDITDDSVLMEANVHATIAVAERLDRFVLALESINATMSAELRKFFEDFGKEFGS